MPWPHFHAVAVPAMSADNGNKRVPCSLLLTLLVTSTISSFYSRSVLCSAEPDASFEQSCDVTVWDSTLEERSVRRVALRCAEGSVTWRAPYGGLQMTFLRPLAALRRRHQHYDLCIAASAQLATVRLAVEQRDTLRTLFVLNASALSSNSTFVVEEKCFRWSPRSHGQQMSLFAEVDAATTSLALGRLNVDYSIKSADGNEELDDDIADCRPCTNHELLQHICSADYAVAGEIADVHVNTRSIQWTTVVVNVSQIVHRSPNFGTFLSAAVSAERSSSPALQKNRQVIPNVAANRNRRPSVADGIVRRQDVLPIPPTLNADRKSFVGFEANERQLAPNQLRISVPTRCQVHVGKGRFLFVGRVRMKRSLRMSCAPRLDEFQRAWKEAVFTQQNPCVLNSNPL